MFTILYKFFPCKTMHCRFYVSMIFLGGREGGNAFNLQDKNRYKILHALFFSQIKKKQQLKYITIVHTHNLSQFSYVLY